MAKKFTRIIENFTCDHCGQDVIGNGYTNHCPHCLWSRHVDHQPGDRAHECRGLMEPVAAFVTTRGYVLTHRCVRCGTEQKCKAAENDEMNMIIGVAKKMADNARL